MKEQQKFRIFATILWGYKYTAANPMVLFRCGWYFFIIFIIVFVAYLLLVLYDISAVNEELLGSILILVLAPSFAVAWHRAILLGENRPKYFRYTGPELKYFFVLIIIFLTTNAIFLISPENDNGIIWYIFDKGTATGAFNIFHWIVYLVSGLFLSVLCILLSVLLPAISVDDRNLTISIIWQSLRGNRFRFIVFFLFSQLIVGVIFLSGIGFSSFIRVSIWPNLGTIFSETPLLVHLALLVIIEIFLSVITIPFLLIGLGGLTGSISISYFGIVQRASTQNTKYNVPSNLIKYKAFSKNKQGK